MYEYRDMRHCNWFWIDNNIIKLFGKRLGTTPIAIYACLCMFANENDGSCYPSITTISTNLGISRQTVCTAVKKLEQLSLVRVEHGKGEGHPNRYFILNLAQQDSLKIILSDSLKINQDSLKNEHEIVQKLDSNNPNITILNNYSDLNTKTPNKVLKTKWEVVAKEPKESSGEAHVSSHHQEVIAYFVSSYEVKTGNKYLFTGRDAKEISNMLKVTDKQDLMKRIDAFFASNDPFYSKVGYTTGLLSAVINKLSVSKPVASGAAGREL